VENGSDVMKVTVLAYVQCKI